MYPRCLGLFFSNSLLLSPQLLETIGKDTNRLYPVGCGEYFEHAAHATEGMTNVLFLWSQLHPKTSYRQGMHELLAPFVWLMESERILGDTGDTLETKGESKTTNTNEDSSNVLRMLLDPRYIQHDAYWMFTKMMNDVEQLFYELGETEEELGEMKETEFQEMITEMLEEGYDNY